MAYDGACHCGALRFCFETTLAPALWSVRACQCSFCKLHAALTSSDPAGALNFRAADAAAVQHYRFGARTADFLICRYCGAYLGASVSVNGSRFGLINVRTLRPFPNELPSPVLTNYDDESPAARIERRAARWTPLAADSL